MKKTVVLSLIIVSLLLHSCANSRLTSSNASSEKTSQPTVTPQTADVQETQNQTVSSQKTDGVPGYEPLILKLPKNLYRPEEKGVFEFNDGYDLIRNDLPKMDGSTSLIPFEAALRSALYGVSAAEARGDVRHSTTWEALDNLMYGEAEAIFTCPLSEEQRANVEEFEKTGGAKLREVPVAMEAFVFVVNADNPVKSLTQKQLRDIYSGKITNWKQVGGRDAEIIAYQRNNDSGSQNYMLDFMKGYELTDAPVEFRAGSMKAAMDAMAYNDNAIDSIGYSVYAYAADMYENNDRISFVAVDGVAPNRKTIDERKYPLLGYNYLMYFDNGDERLAMLEDFVLSEAVQLEAAKSGYVPIKSLNFDFETMLPEMYAGIGAGAEASDERIAFEYVSAIRDYDRAAGDIGVIKNEKLRREIKCFAEAALKKQALLPSENSPYYRMIEKNGYVSMTVFTTFDERYDNDYYDYAGCKYVDCAIWDLKTAKRLSVEECFCRGTDIAAALNKAVGTRLMQVSSDWGTFFPTITDFKGLTAESWWTFDLDTIYLDNRNPYVKTGVNIPLENVDGHLLVWNYERDNREFVYEQFSSRNLVLTDSGIKYTALAKDGYAFPLLLEDRFENAGRINDEVTGYMKSHFPVKEGELYDTMLNWYGYILAEKYFISIPPYIGEYYPELGYEQEHAVILVFDLDSGERISLEDILPESERENLKTAGAVNFWLYSSDGFLTLKFYYGDRSETELKIPASSIII